MAVDELAVDATGVGVGRGAESGAIVCRLCLSAGSPCAFGLSVAMADDGTCSFCDWSASVFSGLSGALKVLFSSCDATWSLVFSLW